MQQSLGGTSNGTTSLFASRHIFDGGVIHRHVQRQRHQDVIRLLSAIEADAQGQGNPHYLGQLWRPQAAESQNMAGQVSVTGVRDGPSTLSQPPARRAVPSRASLPS